MATLSALDDPPYSYPVAARQMEFVDSNIAAATPVFSVPNSLAAQPQRTDVRGAGDGSMEVDRVVILGRKERTPTVADFSREQVASMVCRVEPSDDPKRDAERRAKAMRAYEATVRAHGLRVSFNAGKATAKQLDEAEKEREDAVRAVIGGGGFLNLFNTRERKADLPPLPAGPVVLEDVDLFTFVENGQEVMAVSGRVRNVSAATTGVAPITLQALDRWGFILAGQTSLVPFDTLDPGETREFELRFLNPPDTTQEVFAHFAPPFEYRARRDCDGFDPEIVEASTLVRDLVNRSDDGQHTAAELNELVRIYRAAVETAWDCADINSAGPASREGLQFGTLGTGERREGFTISLGLGKPDRAKVCAAQKRHLNWREAFRLAEAADEAWGARRAADIAQNRLAAGLATQADTDAARAVDAEAYAALRTLGRRSLARMGGSARDVAVEIETANYGHIKLEGFHVEVTGVLRNTGDQPRTVSGLMLALVDRLEQPMMSIILDEPVVLQPGGTKNFTHHVKLRDPGRRRKPEETPSWQVRVGAIED